MELVGGRPLSSPAKRLGAYVLEILLIIVTAGVGWLVWAPFAWARGQTPAKQLLGMRVVTLSTQRRASWGRMALRELVAKPVVTLLSVFTLYALLAFPIWDPRRQELWDKLSGTVVADDPEGALLRPPDGLEAAPMTLPAIGAAGPAPAAVAVPATTAGVAELGKAIGLE